PVRSPRPRVIDADQSAGGNRAAHLRLYASGRRIAEVEPLPQSPDVPMTAVRGHLDPVEEERQPGRVFGTLRKERAVGVGDGEEGETELGGTHQELRRPGIAVGVERVAMEVAANPSRFGRRRYPGWHPGLAQYDLGNLGR